MTEQPSPSVPERPRYTLAGTAPRWRDLEGYYTRFGDVRELLPSVDDRYVIMNAGDELRLRFPKRRPPAAGLGARLRRGRRRLGQGRRLQYDVLADRAAAADAPDRPLRDAAAARSRTIRCIRQHSADFAEYHTRYVTPERSAMRCGRSCEPRWLDKP